LKTGPVTGNLVAAAFVHDSSRALDPQLHTHFTVFNATFDEKENVLEGPGSARHV
jgi:conjugative relaxase-like TrwC/TraI family protein